VGAVSTNMQAPLECSKKQGGMGQQLLQLHYPLSKGLWGLYLAWFSPRGEDNGGYFSFGVCAKC